MSSRDAILDRIRRRLAVAGRPIDARRAAVDAHVAAHPRSPQPTIPPDLVATFRERALKLASTCDRVTGMSEVPHAIARYLHDQAFPPEAACWPALAGLDWHSAGLRVQARVARGGDAVGITGAYCGIAETGTLVLLSGPDTPGTVSLLPETHVAVLACERIVAAMEDAWTLLRDEQDAPPRAVNFVSGPSRTADIEQTVTLGAHGPSRVHLVLVG